MFTALMRLGAVGLLGVILCSAQIAPLPAHGPSKVSGTVNSLAPRVVARVDGIELTERELRREMLKLFPYAATHGGRIPKEFEPEIRQSALDQIILDELVFHESARRKMSVSTSILADVLKQARDRFPSRAKYIEYATQEYGSVQVFENQIRRAILIAQVYDAEITRKSSVTEAQIRQLYDKNPSRFLKPESISIQSISIKIPQDATSAQRQEARRRAELVLNKARSAKNYEEFGTLAEMLSEDDWRVMMGDHKWIHRGSMPAAVEKIAFAMKPDQTSGVIETSDAFVLVRINGYQPQTQLPFAQVAKQLREDLEKATSQDLRKQFAQRLRKIYRVEMF